MCGRRGVVAMAPALAGLVTPVTTIPQNLYWVTVAASFIADSLFRRRFQSWLSDRLERLTAGRFSLRARAWVPLRLAKNVAAPRTFHGVTEVGLVLPRLLCTVQYKVNACSDKVIHCTNGLCKSQLACAIGDSYGIELR